MIVIDCRFCSTFPNRSESVFAVSPCWRELIARAYYICRAIY
ncbi:hypothetical protein HMPREF9074_08761 [Capnocytophaga sp. oral taxon 329 str. F0087]|nr:hypothetical protein HMPREF9074_08761 [Capnocytophaga sp. oral taxon 329 str. F0087]